jgi:hypothetical protein
VGWSILEEEEVAFGEVELEDDVGGGTMIIRCLLDGDREDERGEGDDEFEVEGDCGGVAETTADSLVNNRLLLLLEMDGEDESDLC